MSKSHGGELVPQNEGAKPAGAVAAPVVNKSFLASLASREVKLSSIHRVSGLRKLSQSEQFYAFHAKNPHVFEYLRSMTYKMVKMGYKTVSIRFLCEKLRWDLAVQADGAKGSYAIPTSCPAFYARAIMASDPALAKIFSIKKTWRSKNVEIDLVRMGLVSGKK